MPTPTTINLPPPKSWDEFEDIVLDIFSRLWDDPHTQRYGRSGQAQHGVDIYGQRSGGNEEYIAIQCKLYSNGKLKPSTIAEEVEKLEGFPLPVSEYIIATTAIRDVAVQNQVIALNKERVAVGKALVYIYFWEDLQSQLAEPENRDLLNNLLEKHYPGFLGAVTQIAEEEDEDLSIVVPDDEPDAIAPLGMEDETDAVQQLCEEIYDDEAIRLIEWAFGDNDNEVIRALFRDRRNSQYLTLSVSDEKSSYRICPIFLPLIEPDEDRWLSLTRSATSEDWYTLDGIIRLGNQFAGSEIRWVGKYSIGEKAADEALEKFGVYVPDDELLPAFLFLNEVVGLLLLSYFKTPDGFATESLLSDNNTDECFVLDYLLDAQEMLEEKLNFYTEKM